MIFKAQATGDGIGRVMWPGQGARAAFGRSGLTPAASKREGDGSSPIGIWPLRRVLWRPDKGPRPVTGLPTQAIAPDDGWCDEVGDPNYNRPVKLPYPASVERMWRDDDVYDLVVVLGHNDNPVVPGRGSAIFMHLSRPDWRPTQGCVALDRRHLEALLAAANPGDAIQIVRLPGEKQGSARAE
jgi:L,D-peptidoglycan transpeptidase YkuD (ErfK/YbiS/YcfS/YnhG family)